MRLYVIQLRRRDHRAQLSAIRAQWIAPQECFAHVAPFGGAIEPSPLGRTDLSGLTPLRLLFAAGGGVARAMATTIIGQRHASGRCAHTATRQRTTPLIRVKRETPAG